jgi:hypothetical protein
VPATRFLYWRYGARIWRLGYRLLTVKHLEHPLELSLGRLEIDEVLRELAECPAERRGIGKEHD